MKIDALLKFKPKCSQTGDSKCDISQYLHLITKDTKCLNAYKTTCMPESRHIKNMHLYSTKVVSLFIITAGVFVREVMWVRVMGRQAWTRLRKKIISLKPLNVILQKINTVEEKDVFINSHMHAKIN